MISLLEELFEQGLLKRIARSKDLALKSLKQANYFLFEAQDMVRLHKERMAIIALYNAMFHCTRALLFKDGVKEKSHYAVARYLEFEYVDKSAVNRKFLLVLDMFRDYRHESLYSLVTIDINIDWEDYIKCCGQFIDTVNDMLK